MAASQGNDQPTFFSSASICISVCRAGSMRAGFSFAESAGPRREPTTSTASASPIALLAVACPKLPQTPSARSWVSANTPLPEALVATGAPRSAERVSSWRKAWAIRTPFPAMITGRSASRSSLAACSTRAGSPGDFCGR
jgi:hypothetical protein